MNENRVFLLYQSFFIFINACNASFIRHFPVQTRLAEPTNLRLRRSLASQASHPRAIDVFPTPISAANFYLAGKYEHRNSSAQLLTDYITNDQLWSQFCNITVNNAPPSARDNSAEERKSAPNKPAIDRSLLSHLLSYFKQTTEVRQYLKYFGSAGSERFAVIHLSAAVVYDQQEMERIASSLAFLYKLGLTPLVVIGKGKSGFGVSDDFYSHLIRANALLQEALKKEGVRAEALNSGVFFRDGADVEKTFVVDSRVLEVVEAGAIPLIAAIYSPSSTPSASTASPTVPLLPMNAFDRPFPAFDATLSLAKFFQPLKIICLRPEGGLRTSDHEPVTSFDLASDSPDLADHDAALVPQLRRFYETLETPGATVSVTSPEHLANELLTSKGCGTILVKKSKFCTHTSLDSVDVPRLKKLVESSFGAALPENYFQNLQESGKLKAIYLTEDYRGAAIVLHGSSSAVKDSFNATYLDKFAVDPAAQGDKLGEQLWRVMVTQETKLFWRSRSTNRVNTWYYEQSHGCYKAPVAGGQCAGDKEQFKSDWTVFWRGLDREEVDDAITVALSFTPTFAPKVYPTKSSTVTLVEQPVLK